MEDISIVYFYSSDVDRDCLICVICMRVVGSEFDLLFAWGAEETRQIIRQTTKQW